MDTLAHAIRTAPDADLAAFSSAYVRVLGRGDLSDEQREEFAAKALMVEAEVQRRGGSS